MLANNVTKTTLEKVKIIKNQVFYNSQILKNDSIFI